jgi:hypothetical protein
VTFLDAGGGAAIALMTWRAAKFVRVVDLQKFGLGMADESLSIFIRPLLSLGSHRRGGKLERLANSHVAGFAPVHDIGIGNVDLLDRGIPFTGLLL